MRSSDHEGIAEGEEGLQFNRHGFAAEEREQEGPLVVFVLTDVGESLSDQTKAHVVCRVHRRDFIGCKRLGFKQRDGRLGLGALGVSLQNPSERQSHQQEQSAVIARFYSRRKHRPWFYLKLMHFNLHLCTNGRERAIPWFRSSTG